MAYRAHKIAASIALTLLATGCGDGVSVPNADFGDTDTLDTDTADTGAPIDTGTPPVDSTVDDTMPADTGSDDADTATDDAADTAIDDTATDDAADTATDDAADTATDDAADAATDTATDAPADAADASDADDAMDAGCEAGATMTCAYTGPSGTAGVGVCKAGVRTCTGGAFGACAGEVLPGTESCNGLNDDCDGSTDEGCPATATIGDPTTGMTGYGSASGGTLNTDTCPAGSGLVGINVVVNSYLRQIQGICAPIQLVETTTATPYTYSITTGTQTNMTNRGTFTGTAASAKCAAGSYVVAVEARAGALVDQLTLSCAPLNVTGTIGSYTLARGAITKLAPVGGAGGGPKESSTCAGIGVVNKIVSRTGDGVDYVEMGCATPSITLKP